MDLAYAHYTALDVGTDNQALLNDPLYIGARHRRVRGKEYFGSTNCRRILDRYRNTCATFNDDMQGTGAIAMSGLFNALEVVGSPWADQRVVLLGGGTAGCGIADQIRDQMVRDGLAAEQAVNRIFVVDLPGLLTTDMADWLLDYQRPYAKAPADVGAWTLTKPVIDPSNASRWPASPKRSSKTWPPTSNGRALVATGSSFDDVEHNGVVHRIGQANDAALHPGLGFGAIVARVPPHRCGLSHDHEARPARSVCHSRRPRSPITNRSGGSP